MTDREHVQCMLATAIERAWMDRSDTRSLAVIAAQVALDSWINKRVVDYVAAAEEKRKQIDALEASGQVDRGTLNIVKVAISSERIVDAAILG